MDNRRKPSSQPVEIWQIEAAMNKVALLMKSDDAFASIFKRLENELHDARAAQAGQLDVQARAAAFANYYRVRKRKSDNLNSEIVETPTDSSSQTSVLKSDADYKDAVSEINRLWLSEKGSADADLLELLALLVTDYESRHAKAIDADPIELLKANMELMGRTEKDLSKLFGSRSQASGILDRKRLLTKDMIYLLTIDWKLPAERLVVPYDLDPD